MLGYIGLQTYLRGSHERRIRMGDTVPAQKYSIHTEHHVPYVGFAECGSHRARNEVLVNQALTYIRSY